MNNGDDDFDLFRRTMASEGVRKAELDNNRVDAKPVKTPPPNKRRHGITSANPAPKDEVVSRSVASLIDQTTDNANVLYCCIGVSKKRLQQLRRGDLLIEESIDLHGLKSVEASRALQVFLQEAVDFGYCCIEVIHGKGLRSEQAGGVLKPLTIHWLKQQPDVHAFCSATASQGGSGATWVLLTTGIK